MLTQSLEHPEAFPFKPVHRVTDRISSAERMLGRFQRWMGSYSSRPYLELIQNEKIRLLHAHTGWEAARIAPVAQAAGLPLVASFYGRDVSALPRSPYWRWLYRRLFKIASLYLVEGPMLGKSLLSLGCPADKIRVVHLGVDLDRIPFHERKPHEGPVRILISCSLREKKGVTYALSALGRCLETTPWVLRILGDGPLREQLTEQSRSLGLEERVSFEGYLSYTEHLQALAEADLFLSPSVTASDGDTEGGAPVALIEAQASGLPAVASTHCDIPEIVKDGVTGYLFDEKDVDGLTVCLQRLLADQESWAALGQAGRRHIEREFNVIQQVARAEELYQPLFQDLFEIFH